MSENGSHKQRVKLTNILNYNKVTTKPKWTYFAWKHLLKWYKNRKYFNSLELDSSIAGWHAMHLMICGYAVHTSQLPKYSLVRKEKHYWWFLLNWLSVILYIILVTATQSHSGISLGFLFSAVIKKWKHCRGSLYFNTECQCKSELERTETIT